METDSHGPLGAPGNSGPAGFAFDRPKASAREFHQKQNASLTGKPSWASRAGKPGGVVSPEGLRRLLPEPTPSPRLWAAAPGATPERLCEHTMRVSDGPSKPELSTWLRHSRRRVKAGRTSGVARESSRARRLGPSSGFFLRRSRRSCRRYPADATVRQKVRRLDSPDRALH